VLLAVSGTAVAGGELGNLGEWMSGIGALAALGVSLYLIHDAQVLRARDAEERERAQARLVSCWIGTREETVYVGPPVARFGTKEQRAPCVYVRNTSDQPIHEVVIQPEPFDPEMSEMVSMWPSVPPGETVDSGWPDMPDEPQRARPMVNFVDDNGITWQRDGFRLTVLSRAADKVKQLGLYKVSPPVTGQG
jgi:hypothetical protein